MTCLPAGRAFSSAEDKEQASGGERMTRNFALKKRNGFELVAAKKVDLQQKDNIVRINKCERTFDAAQGK